MMSFLKRILGLGPKPVPQITIGRATLIQLATGYPVELEGAVLYAADDFLLPRVPTRGLRQGTVRDIRGQKFGRLKVLRIVSKPVRWVCECECGREHEVTHSNLVHGAVRSCGCLRTETTARSNASRAKAKRKPAAEFPTELPL